MLTAKKLPSEVSIAAGTCEESSNALCQSLVKDENKIINWLHLSAAHGLIITYDYFFEEMLHNMQVSTSGKIRRDDLERWVRGFRRRWSERLQSGPAGPLLGLEDDPAPPSAAIWYRTVNAAIANRYPAVPFAEPERLLCLGEMNVHLDGHSAAVRGLRSEDEAARACRDNVAFVMAVSASGERAPAMMVTPSGGLVRSDLLSQDDCLHQTTSNGTVTPDALRRYIVESLEPHLTSCQVPRPVLVYVDGQHHHASQALLRFCDDAGLILIGLPPSGAERNPLRAAIAALLAGNLARMADSVQRGRRPEPGGGCSTSARALITGFRAATRRATQESITHAFQWSGLSPWSESIISACESGPPASELPQVELPPPSPPPLPAPVGLPVPPAGLELEAAVRLLLDPSRHQPPPLEPSELPLPGPESVAFLVNNQHNTERLRAQQRPAVDTDDGWIFSSTSAQIYLLNETVFERVFKNNAGRYCVRESVKQSLEAHLTPNDTIVEVQRVRSTWWSAAGCTRRVTFISACHSEHATPPAVALYELCPEGDETASVCDVQLICAEPPSEEEETAEVSEDQATLTADDIASLLAADSVRPAEYTTVPIPPAGMPAGQLIRFLLDTNQHGPAPNRPPQVKTTNTAYLVNNEVNRERRWRGLSCRYRDGPEQWEGGNCKAGQILTYLLDDTRARLVSGLRGRFSERVQRGGRWVTVPLEPPPTGDETEVQLRQVNNSQLGGNLRRRISWVDRCDPLPDRLPAVALYEYMDPSSTGSAPTAETQARAEPNTEIEAGSSNSGSEPESGGERKRAKSAQDRPAGEAGGLKRQRQDNEL